MPGESFNNDVQFNWGKKMGVGGVKKDIQFYESFTYDGMTYALYDCIFLYGKGESEPFIGKLIKIWEQPATKKRVKRIKVLWFFRPNELLNYLGDYAPLENELFLASGEGLGLCNINPLEVIAGKCNVICTSKDKRNRQPSAEEVKMADYVFYCTFDVGKFTISDKIEDKITGVEARYLFNWKGTQKVNGRIEVSVSKLCSSEGQENTAKVKRPGHATSSIAGRSIPKWESGCTKDAKNTDILGAKHFDIEDKQKSVQAQTHFGMHSDRPSKKMRLTDNSDEYVEEFRKNRIGASVHKLNVDSDGGRDEEEENESLTAVRTSEDKAKRGLVKDCDGLGMGSSGKLKLDERITKPSDGSKERASPHPFLKDTKGDRVAMEVARKPFVDRSKWFACLPFEGRMWAAYEQGTLVLLENLSLDYSSEEIEDIVDHAFKQGCTARVIEQSAFSNPHHGQALIIFKSRDAADLVVRKLSKGNLMLANGRPLVGSKATPRVSGKSSAFLGHLSIEKGKFQMQQMQRDEQRKAVSTSHCSQPNTIEYEMAMDWMLMQKKSSHWWDDLHKRHGEEVKAIRSNLKTR